MTMRSALTCKRNGFRVLDLLHLKRVINITSTQTKFKGLNYDHDK